MNDQLEHNGPVGDGGPSDAVMRRIALGLVAEAPAAPPFLANADSAIDVGPSTAQSVARRRLWPFAMAAALIVVVALAAIVPLSRSDQNVSTGAVAAQPADAVRTPAPRTDVPLTSSPQAAATVPSYPNYPPLGAPLVAPAISMGTSGPLTTPGAVEPGLFVVLHTNEPVELNVFDAPANDAAPRVIIDRNPVTGVDAPFLLSYPTALGRPLVLRVIEGAVGDQFVKVQAPVRPHGQTVWVSTERLRFYQTDVRIEVDIAGPGELQVFRGDDVVLTSPIVYGRAGRETALHETYVEQLVPGPEAAPAGTSDTLYGNWLLTIASFSEVLAEFGGPDRVPAQTIHGTVTPGLMGQAISSGGIRVSNAVMDEIVAIDGLIGAPVILFDSSDPSNNKEDVRARAWQPATTIDVGSDPITQPIYGYD